MDLQQKKEECEAFSAKMIAENPNVTDIWYHIENVPLADLEAFAARITEKTELKDNRMRLHTWGKHRSVIFFYSRPLKVIQQPIVVEEEEATEAEVTSA